ncbi:hypothetical protein [Corynebacterium silvaticum]|uniref:Uncharacterized protein n=1 Tax=Corynebacterium silvaticum TaxID=2320431 RepID=A0ACD4PZ20_9CORY|nr:hypothetical protein [Corynebacterium silvaticum]MBH5300319.1 hypothetical protein [Corynebacterium silvaticum]NOM64515.1 hypothetical protein [Corynebacterium silvaticum]NON69998.1 hypothetical protein [Corynebacterium silvaticum]UWH00892.1 hypothetical protein K1I39_03800 [Corynebacterium silvaticum]UWH02939.1 hypothetical protein K1I38_03810 [Corynebacterium silvaticum]
MARSVRIFCSFLLPVDVGDEEIGEGLLADGERMYKERMNAKRSFLVFSKIGSKVVVRR